jgi:hypothetical protein
VINEYGGIVIGDVGAKHFDLIYCNKPTDDLYKTEMSKLKPAEMLGAQYQIM